jgi:hypothetical protein
VWNPSAVALARPQQRGRHVWYAHTPLAQLVFVEQVARGAEPECWAHTNDVWPSTPGVSAQLVGGAQLASEQHVSRQ